MSMPYYQDESVTLHHGDSLEVLRTLPDQSVDCCVTSPPYFGLRDYGSEGQYGLEVSPAERSSLDASRAARYSTHSAARARPASSRNATGASTSAST